MFMQKSFWHDGACGMEQSCHGRCSRDKCKDCCKSFTAFLFSTLGLVISVAAYSAAGGFLFRMIEIGEEERLVNLGRERVNLNRSHHVAALWNITLALDMFYPENWTKEANVVFEKFQADVYLATTQHNWDGKLIDATMQHNWNFAGALLYAVTAITTIGYGHVTPNTDAGKWATMLYSLVGLPLTLMCIANVGKFFARIFKVIYHTCFCGICCVCCLTYRRKKAAKKAEKNNNNDSIKSLNTIGNGAALTITNDPSSGSKQEPNISKLTQTQVWLKNVKSRFSHSMQDSATVPAWVCLVVMVTYIMGGALLFSVWEKWDYLSGAYFCFVTLTTIGFGDLVPGMAATDYGDGEKDITSKLVLCAVYVLFGLALIGMCIDLMQADVINKVKWIARKIGIMEDVKKARKKKRKKIGKQPENGSTIHQLVSASLPEDNTYDSDEEQMQVIVVSHDDEKLASHQEKFNHNNNNSNNTAANDKRSGSTVPVRFRGCKAADSISDVIIDMQQNNLLGYSPAQGQEVNETCVDLTPSSECTPPAYAHCNYSAVNDVLQESSPPASCYDNINNNDVTPLHARLADVEQPLLGAEHIDSIGGKRPPPPPPPQPKPSLGTSKSFHNFHHGMKQTSLVDEVPRRREHSDSDAVVGSYDFLDQILSDPVFKPVQTSILPESTSGFDFSPTDLPPVMSASRTSNV